MSPTFGVSADLVQGIIAGGESALSRATEVSEDDPAAGAQDLAARGFLATDTLVGIAASGRTPYVIGAVRAARAMGALTAALVCTKSSFYVLGTGSLIARWACSREKMGQVLISRIRQVK